MSNPFIGEIRSFAFDFAPQGWAKCEGQLLSISQFTALFSVLGTKYGGNGISTFGLPDLRGRMPINAGQGPGLTNRSTGQQGGAETAFLTTAHLPAHSHALTGSAEAADDNKPDGNELAGGLFYHAPTTDAQLASTSIADTGEGQSHENMSPFLVVNFCIALTGDFPSRN